MLQAGITDMQKDIVKQNSPIIFRGNHSPSAGGGASLSAISHIRSFKDQMNIYRTHVGFDAARLSTLENSRTVTERSTSLTRQRKVATEMRNHIWTADNLNVQDGSRK